MSLEDTLSRVRALDRLAPELVDVIRLLQDAVDAGYLKDKVTGADGFEERAHRTLHRAHIVLDLYLDDLENRK